MNLRILHLSDFHFKTTDKDPVKSFNADLVTQGMIKEIASIVKNDVPFDLVIITGDLAFGGREGQYKVAEAFCQKLLEVTGLPNNKLFVIPGNHDVDRNRRQVDCPFSCL